MSAAAHAERRPGPFVRFFAGMDLKTTLVAVGLITGVVVKESHDNGVQEASHSEDMEYLQQRIDSLVVALTKVNNAHLPPRVATLELKVFKGKTPVLVAERKPARTKPKKRGWLSWLTG